jgi:hypothetical protein
MPAPRTRGDDPSRKALSNERCSGANDAALSEGPLSPQFEPESRDPDQTVKCLPLLAFSGSVHGELEVDYDDREAV